jgi:hypothetical protein
VCAECVGRSGGGGVRSGRGSWGGRTRRLPQSAWVSSAQRCGNRRQPEGPSHSAAESESDSWTSRTPLRPVISNSDLSLLPPMIRRLPPAFSRRRFSLSKRPIPVPFICSTPLRSMTTRPGCCPSSARSRSDVLRFRSPEATTIVSPASTRESTRRKCSSGMRDLPFTLHNSFPTSTVAKQEAVHRVPMSRRACRICATSPE